MAELPIAEFLRERLKEYDPTFEVRKGSAFSDFFFKPMQFILQPIRDEADEMFLGQSLRRILSLDDPDAFNEEYVDDIVANVYVYRNEGGRSSGVARVYYTEPVDREYPVSGFVATGSNSQLYTNPATYSITSAQMSSQFENGLYYFDIPIVSEEVGEDTLLEEEGLVSVADDDEVISVTNQNALTGGKSRETNTELIERAKNAITVRDLVTGKGFQSILFENFTGSLVQATAIGFGDKEMMRDILFNAHVGGKHDGYVKTTGITRKEQDFFTLLVDSTRATPTSTQLEIGGISPNSLGEGNIDRTIANPIVRQVKPETTAFIASTVDLTLPIDLSGKEWVNITVDGASKDIQVSNSADPTLTTRSDIIARINVAFGVNVASLTSTSFQITSQISGTTSQVRIENPTNGALGSALFDIMGDNTVFEEFGDGPRVFTETIDYSINDDDGTITRIVGPQVSPLPSGTGSAKTPDAAGTPQPTNIIKEDLTSTTPNLFGTVQVNDLLNITSGTYQGQYRVIKKDATPLDGIELTLDGELLEDVSFADNVYIERTGIKDGEYIDIEFYYSPLSIDVGKYVVLDEYGRERGIRPGRELQTISDVAFIRVVSIEIIDPITGEGTGEFLNRDGGFGSGGFGEGGFGVGSSSDYYLVVNSPHERYSAFEDSYIVISSAYQGLSFKVTYDCVPEVEDMHLFVRSDYERVLDGDILIKHYIPAFVSTTITYSVDSTDSTVPTNEDLTELVKEFINQVPAGEPLQTSDIKQFILKTIDPNLRYTSNVKPFTLTAEIINNDDSNIIIENGDSLIVPEEDPFPLETDNPLSPRICHWVADEITMVRV